MINDVSLINKSIFQTQGATESMRVAADGYVFEAENKSDVTELQNSILKSTALKEGEKRNNQHLMSYWKRKKMSLKEKEEL